MAIIGISGKIGSGKDTVGNIIQYLDSKLYKEDNFTYQEFLNRLDKHHNANHLHNWQIKKFADKLKDTVCLLIGCTRDQLEDREFKNKPLDNSWELWSVYWSDAGECESGTKLFTNLKDANDWWAEDADRRMSPRQEVLTPRIMLQLLGTEAGREIIHPNIWVNSLFSDYDTKLFYEFDGDHIWYDKKDKSGNVCRVNGEYNTKEESYILIKKDNMFDPNWIITDCRFPNEAQAIRDRGGILIRVERDLVSRTGRAIEDERDRHPSETSLDSWEDWDIVINNNEGIEELINKIKSYELTSKN